MDFFDILKSMHISILLIILYISYEDAMYHYNLSSISIIYIRSQSTIMTTLSLTISLGSLWFVYLVN